ncbi:MAG: M48 family metallopeptidase [Candidatus Bipolaricaulia bacterium]
MYPAIDVEVQKRAKLYQRRKRLTGWLGSGLVFLWLLTFYGSGLSDLLAQTLADRLGWLGSGLSAFAVLFLSVSVLRAPFDYKNDFLIEKEYGFSTQSRQDWFKDLLKGWLISLVILSVAITFGLWALERFPVYWWLVVGLGYFLLVIVLANLFPVLVLPLFYKLKPLDAPALQDKIEKLLQRARLRAGGIYEMVASAKTTKENAMLAGLGKTKRIILWDTLLHNRTVEEVEAVVAHEVGHSYHLHLWKLLFFQGVMIMVELILLDRMLLQIAPRFAPEQRTFSDTLALLPVMMVLFAVLSFLLNPIIQAISRRFERQADGFAFEATDRPGTLMRFFTDIANRQLEDAYPHPLVKFFYYNHPPLGERIAFAERWRR